MLDLSVSPVSAGFGAEVLGIDLREELGDSDRESLQDTLRRYSLVLFRKQRLSDVDLNRAASIFGQVSFAGEFGHRPYVSNIVPDGLVPAGELVYHSDKTFSDSPVRGLLLYALEVPPRGAGGDTLFANAKLAYDGLPDDLRRRIQDLEIEHIANYEGSSNQPITERAVHPLVFRHPVSGEKVLFYSAWFFHRIVGLNSEESAKLSRELGEHIGRPEALYRHEWEPGDLVVWDNITLQHARTNFDPKHRRHLRRMQIAWGP